jgi:hypothetical protein
MKLITNNTRDRYGRKIRPMIPNPGVHGPVGSISSNKKNKRSAIK